jgi:hypothetical protein
VAWVSAYGGVLSRALARYIHTGTYAGYVPNSGKCEFELIVVGHEGAFAMVRETDVFGRKEVASDHDGDITMG